ncbi:UBX domain-containing protein 7-like [Sycon ciliatum]|uniref:UBX domain-containing protein 7-like n=1 Tax=Sycon ciliatum TaxID=27933 RepID=UPI0031F6C6C4
MPGSYKPSTKDIKQFIAVTGVKRDAAVLMLEACNGNVELAIQLQLDSGGNDPSASNGTASRSAQSASSSSSSSGRSHAQATASTQPAADLDEDGIRAPIPARREVLVGNPGLLPARRRTRVNANNPFNHMRDFQAEGLLNVDGVGPRGNGTDSGIGNLSHLFRPPVDIMFRGSLEAAREAGSAAGKWILVDIHDPQVFECQKLNRDLWRHKDVRCILEDSFVFWQVQADSIDGRRFQQFYTFGECPQIAFLDPRTGERLEHFGFMEHAEFCRRAEDFLSRHALPIYGLEPEARTTVARGSTVGQSSAACSTQQRSSSRRPKRVGDVEEAAEMASAIAASIVASSGEKCENDRSSPATSSMESSADEDTNHRAQCVATTRASLRSSRSKRSRALRISSDEEDSSSVVSSRPRTRGKRRAQSPSPPGSPSSAAPSNIPSTVGRAKKLKKVQLDSSVSSATKALAAASVQEAHGGNRATAATTAPSLDATLSDSQLAASAQDESIDTMSNSVPDDIQPPPPPPPDWVCQPGEKSIRLLMRLPDGSRHYCEPPSSSTLAGLVQYMAHLGFPASRHSLMTPFPRRQLTDFEQDSTLESLGFFPTATLCVEELD